MSKVSASLLVPST